MNYEYSGNYFKVIGPKGSPNMGMIVQMVRTATDDAGEHMVLCRRPCSTPLLIRVAQSKSSDSTHAAAALFYPRNLISATRVEIEMVLSEYSGQQRPAA